MDFQIINVILWPHSPNVSPHTHVFKPGKLNIITGASKTGKSALIPVIDYCLAASQCAIPVGAIRNKCSWFGVLIQVGSEQLLLARKNPGKQSQSGEMLMRSGENLDIPPAISDEMDGRVNSSVVKKELNRLAKLTNLELSAENAQRFAAPPGFRDLLAFS